MAFVSSFLPSFSLVTSRVSHTCSTKLLSMTASQDPSDVSRRQFLSLLAVSSVSAAAILSNAPNASAALSFPKAGFNAQSTFKPVPDAELMAGVKAQIAELKKFRDQYQALADEFAKDGQLEVGKKAKAVVSYSDLRDNLNKANSVFQEEDQLKTDKVVRAILQDINELLSSSEVKPGVPRSPGRIERASKWLNKLIQDLNQFLAYLN